MSDEKKAKNNDSKDVSEEASEGEKTRQISDVAKSFRDRRAEKNMSIDEVVDRLKVRYVFIEAMEEGRFCDLPEGLYRKNYIKSYANFLDMNGDEILCAVESVIVEKQESAPSPEPHHDSFSPNFLTIIVPIILIVAIYFGWNYFNSLEEVFVDDNTEIIEYLAAPEHKLTFIASGDVSVALQISDGEILSESIMSDGDVYFAPSEKNIVLKTDKLELLSFYVNGERVVSLDNLEKNDDGIVLDINKMRLNVELE